MKPIAHPTLRDALHSLILSNPFFACLLLQQEIVETFDVPTMAVDGKHLFYNPNFVDLLTIDTCKTVLVNEGEHLMLLHPVRLGNRNPELANEAMDYSINPAIEDSGFKFPRNLKDKDGNIVFKGPLLDRGYSNKSFEDIYAILKQKKQEEQKNNKNGKPQNGNGQSQNSNSSNNQSKSNQNNPSNTSTNQPNNNGQYSPSSLGEVIAAKDPNKTEEELKLQISKAEISAKSYGNLPAHVSRALESIKKPKYDWREILNRFLTEICSKDYSWSKPNRRYLQSGFILPSLYNKTTGNFVFVVDTSGSVTNEELQKAISEVFYCLEILQESRENVELPVIYCDAAVKGMDILTDSNIKPKISGGGGTSYKPAFDYIRENKDGAFDNTAAILYLSDGICYTEQIEEPNCPVLWLITTDMGMNTPEFKRPFGEDIKFDIEN